ncbi:hypothetical protein ACFMQL_08865 [Nonomuraea fastidiosa]|uniref:hypothetical protein n=1 Tax=Nonomuraea TaxID=83681 RepID=UPI00342DB8EC
MGAGGRGARSGRGAGSVLERDHLKDPEQAAEVLAAHRRYAPHITPKTEPADDGLFSRSWWYTDLEKLPEFGDLSTRFYRSERTLSGADYVAYLSTQSAYRMLDDATRADLFAALEEAVGEQVTMGVDTALYLARRTRFTG